MAMDPKHAIRFSVTADRADQATSTDDFGENLTTDTSHHRFATVDFGRLCEWVERFGTVEFNLTMDLELRNTPAVRRFLHCWEQFIAAEGIDNRYQADLNLEAKMFPEPKPKSIAQFASGLQLDDDD